MERKPGQTDKRRGLQRTRDLGLSDPERHLLRKLSAETRSRSTIGVVLSPEEMDFLRRLSGIRTPAKIRKRTRDLAITDQERSLLEALALGEAVDAGGQAAATARPRKRTTEIVLSAEEAALLSRLSGTEAGSQPGSAVRQKLRGGELDAGPGGAVVLELTGTEVRWLNRVTGSETALTEAERSARVQLREKISRASNTD